MVNTDKSNSSCCNSDLFVGDSPSPVRGYITTELEAARLVVDAVRKLVRPKHPACCECELCNALINYTDAAHKTSSSQPPLAI